MQTSSDALQSKISELKRVEKSTHISGPHVTHRYESRGRGHLEKIVRRDLTCYNKLCVTRKDAIKKAEAYLVNDQNSDAVFENPLFAAKYQDMLILKNKINDTVYGRFEAVKRCYEMDDEEGIVEKYADLNKAISLHSNLLVQINRKAIEMMHSVDLDNLSRQVKLATELTS